MAALERWIARIDQVLESVTRRERRGDAAAYDRRRLERERAVGAGRTELERATLDRARGRLAGLLGTMSVPVVTGTLLPGSDPLDLSGLSAAGGARPDLRALDLRLDAAALDRTAASRWWLPDLQLEGGWKGVDARERGRTDGFIVGLSLTLPLWNQSGGQARVAEGEARAAQGRRALLASERAGELAGARAEAVRLRRAAS